MLRHLVVIALLSGANSIGQSAPRAFDGRYAFSMAGQPVAAGTIWVYYFGQGYIRHFDAGHIARGAATIHAGPELLDHEVDADRANVPSYVIAIEIAGVGWYRSAAFGDLAGGFAKALASMNSGPPATGRVDLPPPVRQTIHARNADGSPRRGQTLDLTTYVWNDNHCARHIGFDGDVRRVTTGADGDATFVAPLTDLFLDGVFYEERQVRAMRSLSLREGVRLPAGSEHTVQGAWQRAASREFRILVEFSDGTPAATAILKESEDQETCSASNNLFKADADGLIVAKFAIEHATELCFEPATARENCLAGDQWDELFRTGRLNVVRP